MFEGDVVGDGEPQEGDEGDWFPASSSHPAGGEDPAGGQLAVDAGGGFGQGVQPRERDAVAASFAEAVVAGGEPVQGGVGSCGGVGGGPGQVEGSGPLEDVAAAVGRVAVEQVADVEVVEGPCWRRPGTR